VAPIESGGRARLQEWLIQGHALDSSHRILYLTY
jgi:hypothetical protein